MSCHQTVLAFLLISTISKAACSCNIPFDGSNDIALDRPQGQKSVAQGQVLQYKCQSGYMLTEGTLTLGCNNGRLNGTMPACNRPEFFIGDSNDVELIERPHTIEKYFAYTSVGTRLAIDRKGVIKQWKFYSHQKGFTFFQVWRPIHHRDEYRFILVGQNQVETSGQGEETYDLDEADWIIVQPGDRIGLSEPAKYRGNVPYSPCSNDTHPEDFGVTNANASRGDFSYSFVYTFSSHTRCMEFSFKAVIHPPFSLRAKPDMPTSSVALVSGYDVDRRKTVYLGDSSNFYIPVDGCIKEWQFYAIHGGSGAFQVWRRVGVIGEWRYKLIGQNVVERDYNDEGLLKLKVEEKERIAVKAGDIIGFLYGDGPMGIPYSMCDPKSYPDSHNVSWFQPLTPDSIETDRVYAFKTDTYRCRVLSFRAIVKQACDRPDDLYTSDVDIISRPYRGYEKTAYVGNSKNFYIPADGYVKEWQFFSKHGGSGAFQVWRRTATDLKYELIGQNEINLTSEVAAPYRFSVNETERISVKEGDIIGFLFGVEMTGIPYSRCHSQHEKDMNKNVAWLWPFTIEKMNVGQVYNFNYGSDRSLWCRVFSLKAVIEQL